MASRVTPNRHNLIQDTKLISGKKLMLGNAGEYIVGDGTDLDIVSSNDLTLDAANDIILDSASGITHFYDAGDTDDAFKITVIGGTGATTLETVSAGADGNLLIIADGHVEFKGCAVGFDKISAVDAANVTIDFRAANKAHLDMTGGSISGTLTLQFPATSGNFVLVVQQDGSTRTIAAYATKDAAGNAGDNDGGTGGAVRWTGGSVPDLTDGGNKRDILSFYWDADEEVCYGVASLNF